MSAKSDDVIKNLRTVFSQDVVNTARKMFGHTEKRVCHCEQARSSAEKYASALAKELKLDPVTAVKRGPIKELRSILEKAVGKLDGQVNKVADIGRLRLYIEKPKDIEELRRLFIGGKVNHPFHKSSVAKHIQVTEFEDFYWEPTKTGHVGLNMTLSIDLGKGRVVPFEIQVMHRDMIETDKLTHSNYERTRLIQRQAKSEGRELTIEEQQQIEYYNQSSRARYEADTIRLGLMELRRPDLRDYKPPELYVVNG